MTVMWFSNIDEVQWCAHNQERILEMSLVQNGSLLKHGDRTRGQKELLPQGFEVWPVMYQGVGEVRKREVSTFI